MSFAEILVKLREKLEYSFIRFSLNWNTFCIAGWGQNTLSGVPLRAKNKLSCAVASERLVLRQEFDMTPFQDLFVPWKTAGPFGH